MTTFITTLGAAGAGPRLAVKDLIDVAGVPTTAVTEFLTASASASKDFLFVGASGGTYLYVNRLVTGFAGTDYSISGKRLELLKEISPRITRVAVLRNATIAGSVLRLRPKLMTVSVVMAALVPILWSTGVGSDIMKPIAAPIIGGMVTSTIHVLIVTPAIFYLVKLRALRRGKLKPSRMTE